MSDIIFSVAWNCGEKDCEAGWHKAIYWCQEEGYSVDNYSDGDHEDIEESDLPTNEEVEQSWRDYARHVADTGSDPLGEYMVRHSNKVRERWQFKFNRSIVGAVMIFARHAGREYQWREVPKHISEYLGLQGSARLTDFANWQDFEEALPSVKPMRWVTIHIEREAPRPQATVTRELKRAARRYMARKAA